MKSIRTALIVTSVLVGFAGLSQAQNPAPTDLPRSTHMPKMQEHRSQEHAKHLVELKSKLNLNANQESAWQSFVQSMQNPGHKHRPDRLAFEKMTTPERIDHMQAIHTQHDALMQKHGEATKTFYAQLSADQKKVFDAHSMSDMGGMRGMAFGMQHMRSGQHGHW